LDQTTFDPKTSTRIYSLLVAVFLMARGHEPVGMFTENGGATRAWVFSNAARAELAKYHEMRERLLTMKDGAA
jgi:hypothetical protein